MHSTTAPSLIQQQFVFEQRSNYSAIRRAQEFLKHTGFCLGQPDARGQRGIMHGSYLIGKYSELTETNISELDGKLEGNASTGPITVIFYHSAPRHAVKKFAEVYTALLQRRVAA